MEASNPHSHLLAAIAEIYKDNKITQEEKLRLKEYVIAEDATVLGFYREFETSQDRDNLKSQLMKHASGTMSSPMDHAMLVMKRKRKGKEDIDSYIDGRTGLLQITSVEGGPSPIVIKQHLDKEGFSDEEPEEQ